MSNSCIKRFEKTVSKCSESIAIADESEQFTFNELRSLAAKISRQVPAGMQNQPVAVVLPRIPAALGVFIGALYSGNFYVPLDCASPPLRLQKILLSLEPGIVITSREFQEIFKAIDSGGGEVIYLEDIIELEECSPVEGWKTTIHTDPAYCIFTSGSTGQPKGVVISHGAVINFATWARNYFDLDEKVITGNQASFYFDASVMDIYNCIFSGVRLELIPQQYFSFPSRLLEWIESRSINFVFWVPSVLVNIANSGILKERVPTTLKRILFIGEVMPTKHLNHWLEHFGESEYYNLYGPTEATCAVSCYKVRGEIDLETSIPIGEPCDNTRFLILNESDLEAAKSEIGELCIVGDQLALGYWNEVQLTQASFAITPSGVRFFERMYRTGDLVSKNNRGEILFVGRKDSQIKHLGYRIELGDIESACLSLPDVKQSTVIYDSDLQRIVLFYCGANSLEESGIREGLREALPRYMQPRLIVRVDEMPLNSNGKVDRKKLRKQL